MKHKNSNTHLHKGKYDIVVKVYETIQPEIDEKCYKFVNVIKDCRGEVFHTFENRCVYGFNITIITNNGEVNLTIFHGFMCFKSEFYGFHEKIKCVRKNGFRFGKTVKLTIKIDSSQSHINICYYFKLSVPIMQREFSKILSRKPENVKTPFNDPINPFLFACRKWTNYQ